ncbi:mitogen-activated protein kinase kinase kinase 9, partial [Cichlidogyrus casuarinus]
AIGTGSYGYVYQGLLKDEPVAIKLIRGFSKSQKRDKEASYLSRLRHENVVTFYGIAMLEDHLAIIMEMAHGGSLNRVVEAQPKLSPLVLFDWAKQIVSGMEYLHYDAHIHHRDLKTANILIREYLPDELNDQTLQGKVLLISDFGMASDASNPCNRQSKVGTVAYAAPEVNRQEGFFEGSDVWSFGVILWELLCLEPPYSLLEAAFVKYRIASQQLRLFIPESLDCEAPAPFINQDDIGAPTLFRNLLNECWHFNPALRPNFRMIRQSLLAAEFEPFMALSAEQLCQIQHNWRQQIQRYMDQFSRDSIISQDTVRQSYVEEEFGTHLVEVVNPWDKSSQQDLLEELEEPPKPVVKKKQRRYGFRRLFVDDGKPTISKPISMQHLLHVDKETGIIHAGNGLHDLSQEIKECLQSRTDLDDYSESYPRGEKIHSCDHLTELEPSDSVECLSLTKSLPDLLNDDNYAYPSKETSSDKRKSRTMDARNVQTFMENQKS